MCILDAENQNIVGFKHYEHDEKLLSIPKKENNCTLVMSYYHMRSKVLISKE